MAVQVPELDFQVLTEKAKEIAEKRSMLQAQKTTLAKQIDELHSSLVKEYGNDYMTLFNDAVSRIEQWDVAHA